MAVALKNAKEEKKGKNPFVPDIDDIFEKAKIKGRESKPNAQVCRYGYINKRGLHAVFDGPCHSNLSYPGVDNIDGILQYINTAYGGRIEPSQEVRRAFTEWLVNFSPFRSVFVTHDIEEIMKDQFVIVSSDHPYQLMAGALQAMRALSEHPHAGIIWHELVKNGVHPNLAFYIGYSYSTDGSILYPYETNHTGCYDRNCVGREALVNILNDKPVNLNPNTYRKHNSYSSANSIFYKNGGSIIPQLNMRVSELVAGEVNKKVNPFGKPAQPAGANRWKFKEGCAALAQALKEEFKAELEKVRG